MVSLFWEQRHKNELISIFHKLSFPLKAVAFPYPCSSDKLASKVTCPKPKTSCPRGCLENDDLRPRKRWPRKRRARKWWPRKRPRKRRPRKRWLRKRWPRKRWPRTRRPRKRRPRKRWPRTRRPRKRWPRKQRPRNRRQGWGSSKD